jgi:DtxR family transcriptional regulator, Mn-dependent transcriptional regulator
MPWSVSRPHGHSADDYLEVIYFLVSPIGEYRPAEGPGAIAARVADMLGVSRAAVGEMLKRLAADGLLERGPTRELALTPAGVERAERVVRRHRIVERFLTDFLGYSAAEAHEHADALGDRFTDDMVERIHERLGYPERCPHGWPVVPEAERAENPELVTLAELAAGDGCEIVRLAEHDGDLLHWFYDAGFTPGAKLTVRDVQPSAGHLKFFMRLDDVADEQIIAEKAARSIYVRRDVARA